MTLKNSVLHRKGAKAQRFAKKIKELRALVVFSGSHPGGGSTNRFNALLPLRPLRFCVFALRFWG